MFFVEIAARLYSKLNYVSRKINPQVSIFLDKTKKNNNEKQKSDKIFWALIDTKNILNLGKKRFIFRGNRTSLLIKNKFFSWKVKPGLVQKNKNCCYRGIYWDFSLNRKNCAFFVKIWRKIKILKIYKKQITNSFSGFCF